MKASRPIYMEYETWQAVEELAKKKGTSISSTIKRIIEKDKEVQEIMKEIKTYGQGNQK